MFQVKDIFPAAAPTKEQADKLEEELSSQIANDDLMAYINALKAGLKVHVNEAELARATGAGTESEQ